MRIVVDIADMQVSNRPDDVLITYSLGSCIGLAIYDPSARVAAMLHYMLPSSKIDPAKARIMPFMFADVGIPKMFNEAYKLGAIKERLIVYAVGGSQIMDDNQVFNIGKRNYMILRKMFWKNGILIASEDIGGCAARNLSLTVADGRCVTKSQGKEKEL